MELILSISLGILVVIFIRRSLETSLRLPVWDKFLSKFWVISIIYFLISFIPKLKILKDWYPIFAYASILITLFLLRNYRPALFDASKRRGNENVYLLRNYRPARILLNAFLPLGVVYVFTKSIIFFQKDFYEKFSGRFETVNLFAILWLIGFGIYAFRQIAKEKRLTEKLKADAIDAELAKQKLEKLVEERTLQLRVQNEKLESALLELKSTQAQLIQSEKMASLGELTAGIAHEIQNPLNFVNNFSEVSIELIEDVKGERAKVKGERDEALEEEILNDIAANLEKIRHHGKRADAIVKGMLAHSRSSTGQKEPTDINALCEEYLRLAYHGLKAKDNSFEASFRFEPDTTLPKINVVPQDIGRVLLNLINNAFQAVGERVKGETADVKNGTGTISPFTFHFSPLVTVTTKKSDDSIEICVKDNGPGIPDAIKDKIFQPFFTTKPTGQGTGLGLSLSYDIVKAHGGELKVKTGEGEGSSFIVKLPLA
jgi:signal transduction histidine kinase